MKSFSPDLRKYELGYIEKKPLLELTDAEAEQLIDAFYKENLAPWVEGLPFNPENVNKLLSLSKCRQCGRCCLPNKSIPNHPGVLIFDEELETISKKTKHNLKSLKRICKISTDPTHNLGLRHLPIPCLFNNTNDKSCKIYTFRPKVCRSFPVCNCETGDVTISLRCDYGKDIFRNLIKSMRKSRSPDP